jgi:hypothetical protein
MGMYPKAKLALSNSKNFPASISKPCCGMMALFHQCLGIYKVEMRKQPISIFHD